MVEHPFLGVVVFFLVERDASSPPRNYASFLADENGEGGKGGGECIHGG